MHYSDRGCWVAERSRRVPAVGLWQGGTIAVPKLSNRSMGAVLCTWAVEVLEAAAPGYACSGWGGMGDGRGGKEERHRWPRAARHTRPYGHTTSSGDAPER